MLLLCGLHSFPANVVTPEGLAFLVEFKEQSMRRLESDRQRNDEAESRDGFSSSMAALLLLF
jgi:hypothetical protein